PHFRAARRPGLPHRGAHGGHRAERAGGQGARARIPRRPRPQGPEVVSTARYRDMAFGITRCVVREGAGGAVYLRAQQDLQPPPQRMTDRLVHWAKAEPGRIFMARRRRNADGTTGDWQEITYGEALAKARRIGQALIDRGLSA